MKKIDKLFKSEIHKKIVTFFHENPSSVDTPRGIAAWIGYKKETVKKALDELVKSGILTAHCVSSTTGYSYTQDKKVLNHIARKIKVTEKKLKMKGGQSEKQR